MTRFVHIVLACKLDGMRLPRVCMRPCPSRDDPVGADQTLALDAEVACMNYPDPTCGLLVILLFFANPHAKQYFHFLK